jgi:hypothetical protein
MVDAKLELAAVAAALVVDEGLEYGPAKRRALKALGWPPRTPLPDNDLVEAAVREHLSVYCADTQPAELHALRQLALHWMERLAAHRPHLVGSVWHGTATRLSDVHLQLFCDDPKALEIDLINQGLRYDVTRVSGFRGEEVDALSLHARSEALQSDVGVHLMVYDHGDLRGALQPDSQGRRPRGDALALRRLLGWVDIPDGRERAAQ